MDINFEINEQEQVDLIKKALQVDDTQLPNALNKIAKAALKEYLAMFAEGMPNRAADAKQDRLFFLIQNYFVEFLPTEYEISKIFRIPQNQCKTLLKDTLSRFRSNLDDVLNNSMKKIIQTAKLDDDQYLVVINSDIVKDELNMVITQKKPTYKLITKHKGCASQFDISADSYVLLCEVLGIN
jgi:hypothetical protein